MRPLYIVHDSEREKISCCFFTVVIKNKAIAEHYDGGLKGFMDKYCAQCNNDITVECFMGGDADDLIKDLLCNGLTADEDFTFFDAEGYAMVLRMNPDTDNKARCQIDIGVEWLKSQIVPGNGFYVWYNAGNK